MSSCLSSLTAEAPTHSLDWLDLSFGLFGLTTTTTTPAGLCFNYRPSLLHKSISLLEPTHGWPSFLSETSLSDPVCNLASSYTHPRGSRLLCPPKRPLDSQSFHSSQPRSRPFSVVSFASFSTSINCVVISCWAAPWSSSPALAMVYCGKPSRGCQMCRARRIKVCFALGTSQQAMFA